MVSADSLRLTVSPSASAEENMALDSSLYDGIRQGSLPPTLRIYTWAQRSITLGRGYKVKYKMSDEALANTYPGISILERPTGGGLVVHEPVGEITIALTHYRQRGEAIRELYKKIHEPILSALSSLGIPTNILNECTPDGDGVCFNSPCLYDGMSEGKKILGGGLRVGKAASENAEYVFLYQGTLKVKDLSAQKLAETLKTSPSFTSTWV